MEPDHIKETRLRLGATKSAEIQAVVEGMAETLKPILAGIAARLDALEESRDSFKYCGTWKADRVGGYLPGNFVTLNGGMWHCERANQNARPGDGDAWKLAVKSGQR